MRVQTSSAFGTRHSALIVTVTVFATALVLYFRTLLPGLDLGDTASFQTIVSFPVVNARHAYPLYFALGKLCIWLTAAEPAVALNRLSAVLGAAAAAVLAIIARRLTASDVAAVFTGLLIASSYTFWSQSVIAEVYTLHLLFVGLTLLAWLRWEAQPSLRRFAAFCGVYALSFGNHLMMILLAPAIVLATAMRTRGDAAAHRTAFSGRAILVACGAAAAGSLVYGWSLYGTWLQLEPGVRWTDALRTFWFDVTKADWRETLVGTVPRSELDARAAMSWFDLRQQFGVAGAILGAIGAGWLWQRKRRAFALLGAAWAVTAAFAFWYNVGDTHVFFLPAHGVFALFAGAGAAALLGAAAPRRAVGTVMTAALLAYPTWRIVDTLSAVDRSHDRRANELCERMLAGLGARNSILIGDLGWQVHNALGYYMQQYRPDVAATLSAQVLPHFPAFAEANLATGRDIVMTSAAADRVQGAFGPLYDVRSDQRGQVYLLERELRVLQNVPENNALYVLVVLTPLPGAALDTAALERAVDRLAHIPLPRATYVLLAGRAGSPPAVVRASDRPFRVSTRLDALELDIRIDSWLPFDTMRRAGFGHVIANGRHAVTIERGVTFAALGDSGRPWMVHYAGGSFAPVPLFVITADARRSVSNRR